MNQTLDTCFLQNDLRQNNFSKKGSSNQSPKYDVLITNQMRFYLNLI